jgi:serine/threonine protein kinase
MESNLAQNIKINQNWEALERKSLTPSQISDSKVTNEFRAPEDKKIVEFHRKSLLERGYELNLSKSLGKGTYGIVYKVKRFSDQRLFACKILTFSKIEVKRAQRFRDFKNEIFVMRKVPHINIIGLIEHFIYNQVYCYIVMEFANSGTLWDQLKAKSFEPFGEEEAKSYFVQIVRAIYHLHTRGIAHGDLKLNNVLISTTKDGQKIVKVSDFGTSRVCYRPERGVDMQKKAVGTVPYMSPQLILCYIKVNMKRPEFVTRKVKKTNPFRGDIWALGVCLYLLITGSFPFPVPPNKDRKNPSLYVGVVDKQLNSKWKSPKRKSKECFHIIEDLLEPNKLRRIDIHEVIRHQWLKDLTDEDLKLIYENAKVDNI